MPQPTETDDIREQRPRAVCRRCTRRDRRLLRPSDRVCAGRRARARRSSATLSTTAPRRRTRRTAAVAASLGCGVPTAVADLHEGETVLDLGSGAGADVLISASRVGPSGPRDRPRHDR